MHRIRASSHNLRAFAVVHTRILAPVTREAHVCEFMPEMNADRSMRNQLKYMMIQQYAESLSACLFSNAEPAEDAVQNVFGGDFADDGAELR